jgi:hypothetical protein
LLFKEFQLFNPKGFLTATQQYHSKSLEITVIVYFMLYSLLYKKDLLYLNYNALVSNPIEIKNDYLNGDQVERLKNIFISENLVTERWAALQEPLMTKTAAEFLAVVEIAREKYQAERNKKLSSP